MTLMPAKDMSEEARYALTYLRDYANTHEVNASTADGMAFAVLEAIRLGAIHEIKVDGVLYEVYADIVETR